MERITVKYFSVERLRNIDNIRLMKRFGIPLVARTKLKGGDIPKELLKGPFNDEDGWYEACFVHDVKLKLRDHDVPISKYVVSISESLDADTRVSISVPLEKTHDSVSLYTYLNTYLQNWWHCPTYMNNPSHRKIDLLRLPTILIVRLLRFSNKLNKINKAVFPMDDFEVPCHDKSISHYKLFAVTNQIGAFNVGHYRSYVHDGGDD